MMDGKFYAALVFSHVYVFCRTDHVYPRTGFIRSLNFFLIGPQFLINAYFYLFSVCSDKVGNLCLLCLKIYTNQKRYGICPYVFCLHCFKNYAAVRRENYTPCPVCRRPQNGKRIAELETLAQALTEAKLVDCLNQSNFKQLCAKFTGQIKDLLCIVCQTAGISNVSDMRNEGINRGSTALSKYLANRFDTRMEK